MIPLIEAKINEVCAEYHAATQDLEAHGENYAETLKRLVLRGNRLAAIPSWTAAVDFLDLRNNTLAEDGVPFDVVVGVGVQRGGRRRGQSGLSRPQRSS